MSEFDDTSQLVEGADPTATWGAYASLLLQLVREAMPAGLYGWKIESTETPPTTGADEWRKRCLWYRLPVNPASPTADEKRWYYYDHELGSWENFEDRLRDYGAVGAEAVVLASLSLAMATARQVLRKNAGNTAYEWVDPLTIFNDGEIPVAKLLSGTALPDRIIRTDGSGQFIVDNFVTYLAALFATSALVPLSGVYDDSAGTVGQVLSLTSGNAFLLQWADQLLRDGQIAPIKLNLSSVGANKFVKTNASANGFTGADAPVSSTQVAILTAEAAANTNGQTVSAGATGTVVLNTETSDPDSIVSLDTGTGVFALAAGTYKITAIIPIGHTNNAGFRVQVQLYDVDNTTVIDHTNATFNSNGNPAEFKAVLTALAVPVALTDYSIRVTVTAADGTAATLGIAVNLNGLGEKHSRVIIEKIA